MTLTRLDLVLVDRNIAFSHGKTRQTLDGKAFEHIVINCRLLAAGADGLLAFRIPTTISASAPSTMAPLRGYMFSALAILVEVAATNSFIVRRPVFTP